MMLSVDCVVLMFFFFKQKTAYEMRIRDWSSDVCSSDLDANWSNATELLLAPDHYLYRMLYSQGIALDALGVPDRGGPPATDTRAAWRLFAANFHLFRGTPSRMWLDNVFADVFGFDVAPDGATADHYYDGINESLDRREKRLNYSN